MMVDRELTRLQKENPDLEVTKIDVVTNPLKTWNDNIRMFPALKAGEAIISGVFLGREEIEKFIAEAGQH